MKVKPFILLTCILALAFTVADAKSLLPSLLFDMFNQVSIKPFEESGMREFPVNAVSQKGFENLPAASRFILPPKNGGPSGRSAKTQYLYKATAKTVYQDHCYFCHGNTAETDSMGFAKTPMNEVGMTAPALPTLTPHFSDNYIDQKIVNGGVIMPSQGHVLNETERSAIVSYLRSLEK